MRSGSLWRVDVARLVAKGRTLLGFSKIAQGRAWNGPGGKKAVRFRIYRCDPSAAPEPHIDTFWIDADDCGPMVLDALHKIKAELDPALAFRRSCREGICGSCAMNIGGTNGLACLHPIGNARSIDVYPLPHMPVVRDLVPDLSAFFAHYHATRPRLERAPGQEHREIRQAPTDRAKLDGLYECILCACCSAACPSYWWNEADFPGPAALLQAERWIVDSRDQERAARLERASRPAGVYGCRQILNCTKVCPKGLNPARAIAELRAMIGAGPSPPPPNRAE